MTVLVFFFARELCKRLAQFRKVKDRIVSETPIAPRRLQDHSIHAVAHNRHSSSPLDKRNHANEIRRSLRPPPAFQFPEQFLIPLRARGRGPRVPCRFHSWSAIQHGHNKPGIIRKHKPVMPSGVVQRLAQSIFRKGRCIFFEQGQGIEPRRQRQLDL